MRSARTSGPPAPTLDEGLVDRFRAAEAIVTGDKALLDHTEQLDPRAINLREACELLELTD